MADNIDDLRQIVAKLEAAIAATPPEREDLRVKLRRLEARLREMAAETRKLGEDLQRHGEEIRANRQQLDERS